MFCPETNLDSEINFEKEIITLLRNNVIDLPEDNIKAIYESWRFNFDGTPNQVVYNADKILHGQKIPTNAILRGIDFPSWFGKINSERTNKKIMIVGIDPLRNKKNFEHAKESKDVIIGTPYALHESKMRWGRTKQYWSFIEELSKKHFVYLTDIYKVFFLCDGMRSYNYFKKEKKIEEHKLLEEEFKIIKPDIIITLGGESYFQLMKKRIPNLCNKIDPHIYQEASLQINVIPMVHLSGSTREKNKLDFLKNNLEEGNDCIINKNYGEGYFKIIEQYI